MPSTAGHHSPAPVSEVALNRRGFLSTSLGASAGVSGLELFRERFPEVAIVDIGLPDIDGYELARRIRLEPNGQPAFLIALSDMAPLPIVSARWPPGSIVT